MITSRGTTLSSSLSPAMVRGLALVTLIVAVTRPSAAAVVDWVSPPAQQVRPVNGSATFDCLLGGAGVGNRTVLWIKTRYLLDAVSI